MKSLFYRIVIPIAGLALLMDGLALVDFLSHPMAMGYDFHPPLFRAVVVLVLVPLTLLVAFLIIRRVPGNVVGPLLIVWSGSVAFYSLREEIGPALFGIYYAYEMVFGWIGLFLMFLHFPDGKIRPASAAPWIYCLAGLISLANGLNFLSTQPLQVASRAANFFFLPGLLPYAGLLLVAGLLFGTPIMVLIPVSFAIRYQDGSLLERQQIKWLALFGGILITYSIPGLIAYPLLTGREVMDPGSGPFGMLFYFISSLIPPLAIGISVLRYQLWDIDRIIRRTLVYSILSVFLALIYFSSVLILQTLFTFFFQQISGDLAIVLSTLAIAAAFTPLRQRIQKSIDQRFFRQKYNIDLTIDRFAATARTEVVLESLASALLNNVEESIHPEKTSLWLISASNRK
jgi:hypothetical protein